MSTIGLRLTPPDQSYEGFKFRMAGTLCSVFGFFVMLFFLKHAVVFHQHYSVGLVPEPFRVLWNYIWAYYFKTPNGALELLLIMAGFGGVFWLNLPKQYFAGKYRDYGKEKASPEAKSITFFLTLMALIFVFLSIPFLTLHFPGWVSLILKYGPIALGILQYLALLPDTKNVERMPAIDKLGWDMRSFDPTRRSVSNPAIEKELKACLNLIDSVDPEATKRFLAQGSATVTWSGVDAMFNSLGALLGISPESMSVHRNTSDAIEHALGELLDARGSQPTVVLSSNAEHQSVRHCLANRLQAIYRFKLETIDLQTPLWKSASSKDVVGAILDELIARKPHIAVLSHVFPDTGTVLNVKEVIEAAQKEGLTTLFVTDGSQAVGNIKVSDDVLVRSAYYVFPGHAWLLGPSPVGFLIRNGWLLRVAAGMQQSMPVPRPFSSSAGVASPEALPSADQLASWFALNYVLKHEWLEVGLENAAKHSNRLAGLFETEMRKADIQTVGIQRESSTVVITGLPQLDEVFQTLQAKRLDLRIVTGDLANAQRARGLRVCFHHFHSDEDVRDLAELIANSVASSERAGYDAPGEQPAPARAFRQSA